MSTKIKTILCAIAILYLTLLIFVLTTNITIHQPGQLYVQNNSAYLLIPNNKYQGQLVDKKYFKLTDPKTKITTTLYKNEYATPGAPNIFVLKNNSIYEPGWYQVNVYVGQESFAKHYLGF